jgi:hypothetical protein
MTVATPRDDRTDQVHICVPVEPVRYSVSTGRAAHSRRFSAGFPNDQAARQAHGAGLAVALQPRQEPFRRRAPEVVQIHIDRGQRRSRLRGDHLPVIEPRVEENTQRVALMRGPLLYAIEQVDHQGSDIRDIVLPDDAPLQAVDRPDLLGGVVALSGQARLVRPASAWDDRLYRTTRPDAPAAQGTPLTITAIPYHAWANREAGPMRVWLRRARG